MPQNYLATGSGEWGQVLVEAYSGEDCYTVCFATCNFLSEVLLYYQQKKKKNALIWNAIPLCIILPFGVRFQ